MTDMARQLLQELMGEYQNSSSRYTDPNVCKDHLVDFCANQLFVNTKADLGPCDLVHDDRLREAYQKSADRNRLGYEQSFYDRLQRLTQDLQRKVRRAMDRVTTEADENLTNPHKEEKEERAIILDERIKLMLRQVQELGESGKVDEARRLYQQTGKLKSDLNALKAKIDSINPVFKNENKLEVCEVCGAFLVPNDAAKRLDAHKEGKQHQGYIRIQRALEEYKKRGGSVRDPVRSSGTDHWSDDRHYPSSRSSRRNNSSYRSRSRTRSPAHSRRSDKSYHRSENRRRR
ncbi:splicing factor [Coemansia sp. Benny D115]|nr:splicing factor [Coemansia sp. Benny D115]